jgi:hypothetical protein
VNLYRFLSSKLYTRTGRLCAQRSLDRTFDDDRPALRIAARRVRKRLKRRDAREIDSEADTS